MDKTLKQENLETITNDSTLNTLFSLENITDENKENFNKELINDDKSCLEALAIFSKTFGADDLSKEIDSLNSSISKAYEKQLALASKAVSTKELVLVSLLYKSKKSLKSITSQLSLLGEKMAEVFIELNNLGDKHSLLEKELAEKEEELKSAKSDVSSIKSELEEKETAVEEKQAVIKELTAKLHAANEKTIKLLQLEEKLEVKNKTITELEKKCRGSSDYESKLAILEREIRKKENLIDELKNTKIEIPYEIQDRKIESTHNHYGGSNENFLQREIKELQQAIAKKDLELMETRIKEYNKELLEKINKNKESDGSLKEYISELKSEIEKHHEELSKEKVDRLQKQMESLSNEKQKEWENNYSKLNEQHKTELLILEDRYNKQMQSLKSKIQEMEKEVGAVGNAKNTILNLFNKNKDDNNY